MLVEAFDTKESIRGAMRRWRRCLDAQWCLRASQQIARRVMALDAFQQAATVCLFSPLAGEVCLDAVVAESRHLHRKVCLPAYQSANECYGFKEWREGQPLVEGYGQIPEPPGDLFAVFTGAIVMLVPGLAFDRRGGRLGYGRGFYDRLINHTGDAADLVTVGVCFAEQVRLDVPQDAWDRRMDFVVTERESIDCRDMG